jgi:hypothetical protein
LRIKALTTGIVAAALALALLPAAGTAAPGGGPVASKAGTLISFVSGGKLKIAKRITILVVCSEDCQADATTTIVAPGPNLTFHVAGPLTGGVPGGPFLKPNGPLLKAMKEHPGKFKLRTTITATSLSTGASETISGTFRLKR